MSAALRVVHAAETIRARWEQRVEESPQMEAAQALEDSCQLLDPEVAEELKHLRSAFAAQQSRAETLDGLARRLQDRVAELEVDRDRIDRLEKAAVEARAALAAFCHDLDDPGTAALGALYLLQQATVGTAMQPGETVPTFYRASHDSIVMGLYTTAAEARAHCVAEERRTWSTGANPVFDWIEDEEDGVAELVTVAEDGETESITGYVVTALEVASKYDEEADE